MKIFFSRIALASLTVMTFSQASVAQSTSPNGLVPLVFKFEGLVDTYYAYDFDDPPTYDRAFTTQPARSDEFNVNLSYIGATFSQERVRGRFALQAGTSVQSNYAGEPTVGAVSGPSLSRNIQEAYAGYQLTDRIWIDAGTYFSHVGAESFISRDNLTYTRSLVADYSPYYQSGVKLSYQTTDKLSLQLHLINGWQNVSENNRNKTVGTQLSYQLSPAVNLTYNTLIGKEAEFRHFHDLILKYKISDSMELVAQADVGFQKKATSSGTDSWYGAVAIMRFKPTATTAINVRAEKYTDDDQIIVATAAPNSFDVTSASVGYDVDLSPNLKWRSEYRHFWASDDIYPDSSGLRDGDNVAVTSATLSF